jgi:hypothetical protein
MSSWLVALQKRCYYTKDELFVQTKVNARKDARASTQTPPLNHDVTQHACSNPLNDDRHIQTLATSVSEGTRPG